MAELARCPHCGEPVRPDRGPAQDERACPRCGGAWRVAEEGRLLPQYAVVPTAFEPDGSWRPTADTMRLVRRG